MHEPEHYALLELGEDPSHVVKIHMSLAQLRQFVIECVQTIDMLDRRIGTDRGRACDLSEDLSFKPEFTHVTMKLGNH